MAQGDPFPGPFLTLAQVIAELDPHHRRFDFEIRHPFFALLHVTTVATFVISGVTGLTGHGR